MHTNVVDEVAVPNSPVLYVQHIRIFDLQHSWKFHVRKFESDETPRDPLERDTCNVLVAAARDSALIETTIHEDPSNEVVATSYCRNLYSTDLMPTKHEAITWLPPADMATCDLAPTGHPIVKMLSKLLANSLDLIYRLTPFAGERA